MADAFQTETSSSESQPPNMPIADTPTLPLMGGVTIEPPRHAGPRRSRRSLRRRLWLGAVISTLLLAAVAAGAVYVYARYQQPMRAANTFCSDLAAQRYTAAYGLFSSGLRQQMTLTRFSQAAQTLDTLEGRMTACHSSGGYQYSLGGDTASVRIALTRAKQGNLSGPMRLIHERDGWKVDTLDSGLLGVSLGALDTADAFCATLQSQDYAAAYNLLGGKLRTATSEATYTAQARERAQVDGAVQSCALTGLKGGDSTATAGFTVNMMRAKLGSLSGNVTLALTQGVWRVTSLDAALVGSDLSALDTGAAFCGDLINNDYAGAYAQLSSNAHNTVSLAQFQQQFAVTPVLRWSACAPDLTSYHVSGGHASYTTALKATRTDTGDSTSLVFALTFTREGSAWRLDSWMLVTVQ